MITMKSRQLPLRGVLGEEFAVLWRGLSPVCVSRHSLMKSELETNWRSTAEGAALDEAREADNPCIPPPLPHLRSVPGLAISVRIIHMNKCCQVWVGLEGKDPVLDSLAAATKTPHDEMPSATVIHD